MAMRPAIFLDKDGTVLVDVPFNVDPAHMRLAPTVAEGIRCLAALGLPLIVVSNQPGLALGRFAMPALMRMEARLREQFAEAGAELAGFYYCPHDAAGTIQPYARACDCRKPAPGLLLKAAQAHGADLPASWMIGDILHDIEAGRRAGCRTILIDNGNETEWLPGKWRTPHYCVDDFAQAARIVAAELTACVGATP